MDRTETAELKTKSNKRRNGGFSLSLVLVFTGVLFLLLSGVLAWTTTNSNLTQRYNEYYNEVAAAEAATEKVVAMATWFQRRAKSVTGRTMSSMIPPACSMPPTWPN
ncbi:MAG: hypothetical protein DME19_01330 [Verrucomicrobia bacterium]|nr:MAG: hypothetical protein DME19_01330 [Verrucomicrobiota bacterium]